MYNKNKLANNNAYSNESFEIEKDEHRKRKKPGSPLPYTNDEDSDIDEFINDLDNMDQTRVITPPRNASIPHALEGITEENTKDESPELSSSNKKSLFQNKEISSQPNIGSKANASSNNIRDDNRMSLSNFKQINMGFIPDESDEAMKRNISVGSMLYMKEIHPEVHTGKRYRKYSALLITPKLSDASNIIELSDSQLNIRVLEDPNIPQLFIEFDCLQINPMTNSYCWIEKSRWLKYEEDYDLDLKRFNIPHLSAMSLRGLIGFRKYFKKGDAILNCHSEDYTDILKSLSDNVANSGDFSSQEIADIRNALILKHYHAGDQLRSRQSDTSMFRYDYEKQCFERNNANQHITNRKRSIASLSLQETGSRKHLKLNDRLDPTTEALSVQVGALESFKHVYSLFVRLDPPIIADGLNEVNCPLRFIYILFGPKAIEEELLEVGRAFSIMMSIPEFRETAYSSESKKEIIDATKTFLNHSVIVPLTKTMTNDALSAMLPHLKYYSNLLTSEHNRKTFEDFKKEMYEKEQEVVINQYSNGVNRKISIIPDLINNVSDLKHIIKKDTRSTRMKKCCLQFLPPFKHMFLDFKGLKERYASDFKDAFLPEHISIVFIGMIFIYFVVLSPAITFGALFNQLITKKMSVSMCLVSSGFFQLVYVLLSGQPLEIVGITAPVYVVERVLGSLSKSLQIELEIMRFWIGVYVAILGFVFSMFNGVIIIKHFRRSVEEVYNCFVGIIFILSALFTMFKALPYTYIPVSNFTNITQLSEERFKFGRGGTTLFMAFLMLNFCLLLFQIKRGSFFRRQIRNLLGSFNVPLGIILIVAIERIFFQAFLMPTLNIPPSDQINASTWINPPNFSSLVGTTTSAHLYCFGISLSLFFILIVEVSTNSICVTKTERKLVKCSMFSLNYFYILVIFPLISAFLGWPYVSGAMVRSNSHCIAMAKWSLNNLPGVSPKVTGAAEQRVSGLIVGILVFLSVFLGSALRYIPMAAMYGMFLYMGVMGVRDLVLTRRLKNLFQRRKHWHQHDFLKDYPSFHIFILIFFQLFFISILIVLNCLSEFTIYAWTPLIFPFFIGLYGFIRGYILPLWPKLNKHLSKMDKKHQVKLYDGQKPAEQIMVIKDNSGLVVVPVASVKGEDDSSEETDLESDLDKELW